MSEFGKMRKRYKKMNRELGHEAPNNYYITIGNSDKFWKVVKDKKTAEKIAATLRKKGKKVGIGPTSAKVTESVENVNEKVSSTNRGMGYHGAVGDNDKKFSAKHAELKKKFGAAGLLRTAKNPNKMITHFLDSRYGSKIGNDNPSDEEIMKMFKTFMKSYNPGLFEDTSATTTEEEMNNNKTFFEFRESIQEAKKDPCWKDYEMVGHKKKNGKKVPNCVPKESSELDMTPAQKQKMKNLEKRAAAGNSQAKKRLDAFKKELGMGGDDEKKKPASNKPEPKKRGEYDKADDNVIMQLRKAQDVDGNMDIKFHRGKTGRADAKDIADVLKFHDMLQKPDDKRKLRIGIAKGGPPAIKKFAAAFRKVGKK